MQENYLSVIEQKIRQRRYRLYRALVRRGRAMARQKREQLMLSLHHEAQKLKRNKIDLVVEHARELIIKRLHTEPLCLVAMAQNLFKNLSDHADIEVSAEPRDAKVLRSELLSLERGHSSTRKVNIHEDHALDSGSLIIKAHKSIIDAQIDTQLENAKAALLLRCEIASGADNKA